jgi:hypothetical protein
LLVPFCLSGTIMAENKQGSVKRQLEISTVAIGWPIALHITSAVGLESFVVSVLLLAAGVKHQPRFSFT